MDLMHWLATNKDSIEALFYFASGAAALFAGWTYWRNARTRRAEWLFSLYQKFFEGAHYKNVRFILDYQPEPEFSSLKEAVEEDRADQQVEQLVDYLNFFEFTARLWHSRQLTLNEIDGLFNYYLGNLTKHDFVREFLKKGFEALQALLDIMERKGLFKREGT